MEPTLIEIEQKWFYFTQDSYYQSKIENWIENQKKNPKIEKNRPHFVVFLKRALIKDRKLC